MDGRTYYFDKGDLKDNYGSTKYYEIRRYQRMQTALAVKHG